MRALISPAPTASVGPQSSEDLSGEGDGCKLIETAPSPSAVSVRTRFPTPNAQWNVLLRRPGAAALGGCLERVLHLTQDLRFTEHQRVQAGGDAEQMVRSRGVFMGKQMQQKRLARELSSARREKRAAPRARPESALAT